MEGRRAFGADGHGLSGGKIVTQTTTYFIFAGAGNQQTNIKRSWRIE